VGLAAARADLEGVGAWLDEGEGGGVFAASVEGEGADVAGGEGEFADEVGGGPGSLATMMRLCMSII
jgi:hypothetical protein